jgi:Fur family ferric uptake transcriptional regulator
MSVAADVGHVLREHGYRLTSPRWLVWSALRSADGHLTAEAVTERVNDADPTINRSSVYRSLTLFEELHLVRRSHLGIDESARWEIAHPDDKFHLVCRSCGSVRHHAGELVGQIRSHLARNHRFVAESIDLVVTGKCADCAGARDSAATQSARTPDGDAGMSN